MLAVRKTLLAKSAHGLVVLTKWISMRCGFDSGLLLVECGDGTGEGPLLSFIGTRRPLGPLDLRLRGLAAPMDVLRSHGNIDLAPHVVRDWGAVLRNLGVGV